MSVYLSTIMRGFGNIRPLKIIFYLGILLLFFNLIIGNIQGFNGNSESSMGTLPLETDNYWYIDNEIRIRSKLDFIDGNIVINSTGKVIIENNGELNLENVNIGFNSSGVGIPTIHVLDGGMLSIKNMTSRITYSNESDLTYKLVVEANGSFEMDNCYWTIGNNESKKSGLILRSSKLTIRNSVFGNGYTGLNFQNIDNLTITNCTFLANNYGCVIVNSSNVDLDNCTFNDNLIKDIQLINSQVSVTNLNSTYYLITNGFELDNASRLDIYWYLNLLMTDKSDKPISSVQISVIDGTDVEVFVGETNETGQLSWIKLLQQSVSHNSSFDYNPFKIKASKDVKDKDDYTGAFYIELSKSNSSISHIFKLKKDKKADEGGLDDPLMLFCICGMTIVTVFLILMSVNVYLARKKVGLDKYSTISGLNKDQRAYGSDSEFITCSECGTQVTDDADFCPHCGEYFEGEEVFCPGCSARISEKATTCPKCGRIFEEDTKGKKGKKGKKDKNGKEDKNAKKKLEGEREGEAIVKDTQKGEKPKGKIEPEKLLCSECGAVVDRDDTKCPGCGFVFEGDSTFDIKKVARKITRDEEQTKSSETPTDQEDSDYIKGDYKDAYMCSICGASVSGKTKVCPKCGTELE
jgi:predicted amidophosphoribosyltransferase